MARPAVGARNPSPLPRTEAALKRPRDAGGQPLDIPLEEMCT